MIVEGVDGPSGPATSGLIGISTKGIVPTSEIPSAMTICRLWTPALVQMSDH